MGNESWQKYDALDRCQTHGGLIRQHAVQTRRPSKKARNKAASSQNGFRLLDTSAGEAPRFRRLHPGNHRPSSMERGGEVSSRGGPESRVFGTMPTKPIVVGHKVL